VGCGLSKDIVEPVVLAVLNSEHSCTGRGVRNLIERSAGKAQYCCSRYPSSYNSVLYTLAQHACYCPNSFAQYTPDREGLSGSAYDVVQGVERNVEL
jgi:hypothetical protein